MPAPFEIELGFDGFEWADLHDPAGLARLLTTFDEWLGAEDAAAYSLLCDSRSADAAGELSRAERSAFVIRLAPWLGRFLARLFRIEDELDVARANVISHEPVFQFRKRFVKKRLLRPNKDEPAPGYAELAPIVWAAMADEEEDEELAVAVATLRVLDIADVARKVARAGGATWTDELRARLEKLRKIVPNNDEHDAAEIAERALSAFENLLRERLNTVGDPVRTWPSLRSVHKQDFSKLVPLRRGPDVREWQGAAVRRGRPEPFALTDDRGTSRQVAAEIDDCIYCHERDKDSCRQGLRDKAGTIKKNPLGIELGGCPLDEKIGEAQVLRRSGALIGALAAVTLDNPLCPGTGHRICNDCMKSCIFQKQEPVNVPHVETGILDDVLNLPWGFEIWSLLTRFQPLNLSRPTPREAHGYKTLVVGLGPAGYTLSHYLLNEGFDVVAIDGLKIEPLPGEWLDRPIRDVAELREPLESRTVLGFGGVSEYGITVRWDKSFLSMLYLNLVRRERFRSYGGVRFGGTITLEGAWELGFDHVAIAAGAGRPTLVKMKNGLSRGVRQASDFLMALQLSGAFRRDSLSNLQLRLPALVIGSGLTAIDTATEALAYYVVQAEKTRARYTALVAAHGEAFVRDRFDEEERGLIDELLGHGQALSEERAIAASAGREPDFAPLLDAWGGVKVVYRRGLTASPAYRLNHEEVVKSLEEGVRYVEHMTPVEVEEDRYGAVRSVVFEHTRSSADGTLSRTGEHTRLAARSVFIAAGTKPNVTYEREYPGTFELDERGYFRAHDHNLKRGAGFFTSYRGPGDQRVSFYGDNHPKYAGSVVKAMASAKDGHSEVVRLFGATLDSPREHSRASWDALSRKLDDDLTATVHEVRRLAPSIVEVIVRAPRAAREFEPGQFYRMQSYERHAERIDGTPLMMEGLALTGASTDVENGLLSMIVLEMGASSKLCAYLKVGEPLVVMGPTGRPSEIAPNENVLLVGGGLGNAVLFSIARAFRAAGSKVLYFAGYRDSALLFKREEIEAATDQVIWATDVGAPIEPARPQDRHFRGNIVEAMTAFGTGQLGGREIELSNIDRLLAIGSDSMMNAVARARHGVLEPLLKKDHIAIGSINSPMQCMMKEVCAQCLQRHVDPVTGEERIVYSCFDQDQPLDNVDFRHLEQRLKQSSVQEKLSDLWLERLTGLDRAAE